MRKITYILYRTALSILLLFGILSFLFVLFRLMPGSYADMMLFRGASESTAAASRQKWGIGQPLYVQYYNYIVNFIQLDIGTSHQYNVPVWEYTQTKILNSFMLAAPAITASYLIGTLIGLVLGTQRGSTLEKYTLTGLIFVGSFPSFFLGIVLIVVFAGGLGWFPTSGMGSIGRTAGAADPTWWEPFLSTTFLWYYTLPFATILLKYLYFPSMIMRANVVEVKDQPFFNFHRMTGLSSAKRLRHLLKHSSLPVITMYPISMTRAIGGLVLVEIVFSWPGIGKALIDAIKFRDIPVVQFVFFLIAVWIIFGNFIVDIVYSVIDPRVGLE